MPSTLKLGLIGDNIAASRAPRLHQLAGALCGIPVRYDLLIPRQMSKSFEEVFAWARQEGYQGLNITLPYKETVAPFVSLGDPSLRRLKAVNTVVFNEGGATGQNTDLTGFAAAYRAAFGVKAPGVCALLGAGGVGRALAFALVSLGAARLQLFDRDSKRAEALARDLASLRTDTEVRTCGSAEEAAQRSNGILNATPLGMVGYGGTPLPRAEMKGADWVFDAVYTPLRTPFLTDAEAMGLRILSGYELFFYQGIDAWRHFSGHEVDPSALREALHADAQSVSG